MSHDSSPGFGRLRAILWPIYRWELARVLPMFFMVFLICFNYSIIRNMKDALVVTAKASGAEVIPFLKVWAILPGAFLATFIYTRLSNRFSQERVFYIMVSGFLLFYTIFAFVLYPLQDLLHPNDFADRLEILLPGAFRWFIAMLRNWTFSAFYVMSELWSVVVFNILFWGFANQITKVDDAKRFYSVFTLGGNISAILAGRVSVYFCQAEFNPMCYGRDSWEQALVGMLLLVVCSGIIVMILFRWTSRHVIHHQDNGEADLISKPSLKKRSLRASFRYLLTSKYLIYIAILVVSYNLTINLVEVIWKDRLGALYPQPQDFNTYMNQLTMIMGIISTVLSIFISVMIREFGWRFIAVITPLTVLVTGAGFFTFLFLPEEIAMRAAAFVGMTPLAIVVLFGGIQNCLSKAAKYSVFDASKEIAFIPLPHESKLKGKAAIDGVGSRIGKSGGALIHQGLLMVCTTLVVSAPYVCMIIVGIVATWMSAVRSLGRRFDQLTNEETSSEDIAETPPLETEAAPAIS